MKRSIKIFLVLSLLLSAGINVYAGKAPKAVLAKNQTLSYNLRAEPETLDPGKATGTVEGNVILACFEGLTKLGTNKRVVPGVAEKWTVSPDGKTYTFYLRKNAKWSNGDPVTAKDFEYSWRRTLNPKTASEYAANLFVISNAEEYNSGKITDASKVGVKATDDATLVVTLKGPCAYFPSLATHHALFPVNRKTVEANPDSWAKSPQTYIGNGPFRLVNWVHNEKMEFIPNTHYWNTKAVKLKHLLFYMVEEQSTALTMFESGQLDFDDLPPLPELPRLQKDGILQYVPMLGTYYYMFNVKKAPFNDVRVRKALALAINRQQLIKYVTKGGEKPATAFVPNGIVDARPGQDFRKTGGNYFKDASLAQAKKLLAEAGYSDPKKFPPVEILYNTNDGHKLIAEAIQELWGKGLGIRVNLTNQEWKVYLQSRVLGSFQIVRAGWIGDYADPMSFLDIWTTHNGNNHSRWSNARYDRLIDQAQRKGDPKTRMQILHNAEKIVMSEMPCIPIYFYTRPSICQKWVRGINCWPTSMNDFSGSYILAH